MVSSRIILVINRTSPSVIAEGWSGVGCPAPLVNSLTAAAFDKFEATNSDMLSRHLNSVYKTLKWTGFARAFDAVNLKRRKEAIIDSHSIKKKHSQSHSLFYGAICFRKCPILDRRKDSKIIPVNITGAVVLIKKKK
jgi:hypothetical protein